MKNTIIAFLLMMTTAVFAQVPRGFSVAAGANHSIWDSKDLLADGALGFTAGIGFNFGYHESFNYEFNVMLSQQYLKLYSIDNSNTNIEKIKTSMQTADFSAQFNYYVIKPDENKFYAGALAGIKFSVGTGDLSYREDSTDINYLPYRIDNNQLTFVSQVSYAPIVGIVAGYNKFRLAVKYEFGVTNIIRDVQTNQQNEYGIYTGPAFEGKLSSASLVLYYHVF